MRWPIDETHDANLTSWVESANDPSTDFPIQNLPYCVFRLEDGVREIGVAIGDSVARLGVLAEAGLLDGALPGGGDGPAGRALRDGAIECVMGLDRPTLAALRGRLSELLRSGNEELAGDASLRERAVVPVSRIEAWDTVRSRDYTDFYASIHHATNVGSMFRPDNPLMPNYRWIPVGYHGRASSIVPTGTPVRRPSGQTKADDADAPVYGPCKLLDYEMEVGIYVGSGNRLGEPVPIGEAEAHLFGLCLLNDWSARDIQKWEYQPLGPFLAKSFASTVSPFIVTMDALAPFRCPAEERGKDDPKPLPHLHDDENQASGGVDMTVEVWLRSAQMAEKGMEPVRISRGGFRSMYWTPAQMLAHHASNGCNMAPGDLLGSGTVSGPEPGSRGCLLEMTWDGRDEQGNPKPRRAVELPTGEKRIFLQDGDEVILRGFCDREGYRRIGLGECRGKVLPAAGG